MSTKYSFLFETSVIGNLEIPNRLVVAPMTRVSAEKDGTVGPLMKDYYKAFAAGGFGLIITEGLYTDQLYSQAYLDQPGIATQEQALSWEPVIKEVHDRNSVIFAQLMHAGALSQFNRFVGITKGPSAVQPLGEQMPFYHGSGPYQVPKAMTQQDIDAVIKGFSEAAVLAKNAGFDGVEIHGANGYLLDQFLTGYTNKRDDLYGGSIEGRLCIYREVANAVRAAVGDEFVIGFRFSQKKVNDIEHVWEDGEDAAKQAFSLMRDCAVDYIHTAEPNINDAAFSGSAPLSELAKKYSGLPVIANGGVSAPETANVTLKNEQADFVALGKIALANQDWPAVVKAEGILNTFDFSMLSPIANLSSAKNYFSLN
ncbi:NADH:flavin oxidoreductase [Gammaproteobacteria bacterium 45_16_T64]|nr:NADH:flavin oxidoreductase [Gammaproteobacteria bacterium 45_16_T64]